MRIEKLRSIHNNVDRLFYQLLCSGIKISKQMFVNTLLVLIFAPTNVFLPFADTYFIGS